MHLFKVPTEGADTQLYYINNNTFSLKETNIIRKAGWWRGNNTEYFIIFTVKENTINILFSGINFEWKHLIPLTDIDYSQHYQSINWLSSYRDEIKNSVLKILTRKYNLEIIKNINLYDIETNHCGAYKFLVIPNCIPSLNYIYVELRTNPVVAPFLENDSSLNEYKYYAFHTINSNLETGKYDFNFQSWMDVHHSEKDAYWKTSKIDIISRE